jgi:hypothetical protein
MLLKRIIATLVALFVFCGAASAEELTPEKRADIERLLGMTGALALGKQMANAVVTHLTQSLKAARPDIPQKVINVLPAEVSAVFDENIGSLQEDIIPIYHKYFTAGEVKELIRFYSTDVGQKAIKVMPLLMQEGMTAGQRWGQSLGPKIEQRVTAKLKQQGIKI